MRTRGADVFPGAVVAWRTGVGSRETPKTLLGVSENRGPLYSTLNSRILMIRTPKYGTPYFRKLTLQAPLSVPEAAVQQ